MLQPCSQHPEFFQKNFQQHIEKDARLDLHSIEGDTADSQMKTALHWLVKFRLGPKASPENAAPNILLPVYVKCWSVTPSTENQEPW